MTPALYAMAVIVSLTAIGDAQRAATTRAANPLPGRWEVVSVGGKQPPRDLTIFWVFDASHLTVEDKNGEQVGRNPYSFDSSKQPPTLTITPRGEPNMIGWCRFEGKELRIVMTTTGQPPKGWNDGEAMILRSVPQK